jgi:hypothetical protein
VLLIVNNASEREAHKLREQERCYLDHAERDPDRTALTRENPSTGEAMRRELLMNDSVFIVYSWYIFIVRRLVFFLTNPNQTRHES